MHRIGRTGRAGRAGTTILFVTPKESRLISALERHTRQRIEKISMPNDHMIQEARTQRFMANITDRLTHPNLPEYKRIIEQYIKDNTVAELDVAAAVALLLHQDKPWQKELSLPKAVIATRAQRSERPDRSERPGRSAFTNKFQRSQSASGDARTMYSGSKPGFGNDPKRLGKNNRTFNQNALGTDVASSGQDLFRLDVGRVHGVKPSNIVGAIANEAGLQSKYITGLKIHDDHSTVCLPRGIPKDVMHGLTKAWVCGRQLNLTLISS